jgi:hypothetical protein
MWADFEQVRLAAGRCLARGEPQPARSRALSNIAPAPIAAIKADAINGPTPGIVASRRASSFSRARPPNSASKAQMRRSSFAHCAQVGDEHPHLLA